VSEATPAGERGGDLSSLPGLPPALRDEASAEFFDAMARGVLLLRRCVPLGHYEGPEAIFCRVCGGTELEWSPAGGGGELVSWGALRARPDPAGEAGVLALLGLVELDEGPWLYGRVAASSERLVSGQRVTVAFVMPEEGEAMYVFVPA